MIVKLEQKAHELKEIPHVVTFSLGGGLEIVDTQKDKDEYPIVSLIKREELYCFLNVRQPSLDLLDESKEKINAAEIKYYGQVGDSADDSEFKAEFGTLLESLKKTRESSLERISESLTGELKKEVNNHLDLLIEKNKKTRENVEKKILSQIKRLGYSTSDALEKLRHVGELLSKITFGKIKLESNEQILFKQLSEPAEQTLAWEILYLTTKRTAESINYDRLFLKKQRRSIDGLEQAQSFYTSLSEKAKYEFIKMNKYFGELNDFYNKSLGMKMSNFKEIRDVVFEELSKLNLQITYSCK